MNNIITIENARHIPIGELAELEISKLILLREDASSYLKQAKNLKEWIDSAISLKYQNRVADIRESQDKITGTINFNDGDFKVSSFVSKKVEWNQDKLQEAVSLIKDSGENPYEYVSVSYKIPEAKFNAWPEHIKKIFRNARILKTGKETFKIEESIKEVSYE